MRLSGFPIAAFGLAGILSFAPLAGQNIISAKSGLIHYTEGDVKIGDQSAAPNNGVFQSLEPGKELATAEGRAEMLLAPGQFLRLNENSTVRMVSNKLDATRLELVRGSVLAEIVDMARNAPVTVSLGANVIELRKDGLYRIDSDQSRLRVYDGEAVVSGNSQTLTVKKGREAILGAVYAENGFDANTGDEFSRWAQRRAGYLATVNVASARQVAADGDNLSRNNWAYNPWYGMYTYVPNNRMYMSPFGFYYFSPDMAFNDMFWPYLGGGYGFYGAGFGYGYGMGFDSGCGYGCGLGYGFGGYGSGFGYPSTGGTTGVGGGSGGGGVISRGSPRGRSIGSFPINVRNGGYASRGLAPSASVFRGGPGLVRGSGAGPVRGSGTYGGSYNGGYSNNGLGGFSGRSAGMNSGGMSGSAVSAPSVPMAPGGGGGMGGGGAAPSRGAKQ